MIIWLKHRRVAVVQVNNNTNHRLEVNCTHTHTNTYNPNTYFNTWIFEKKNCVFFWMTPNFVKLHFVLKPNKVNFFLCNCCLKANVAIWKKIHSSVNTVYAIDGTWIVHVIYTNTNNCLYTHIFRNEIVYCHVYILTILSIHCKLGLVFSASPVFVEPSSGSRLAALCQNKMLLSYCLI